MSFFRKRPLIPSHPREPYSFLTNRLGEAKVQESLGTDPVITGAMLVMPLAIAGPFIVGTDPGSPNPGGVPTPLVRVGSGIITKGRSVIMCDGTNTPGLWVADSAGASTQFIGLDNTTIATAKLGFYNSGWRLQVDNAGVVTVPTGPLIVGADPGSTEKLRVGGSINISNGQYISFGGTANAYFQVEGTPRFVWSLGNTTRMRLETVSLNPVASGGLTLGTASLPWGASFFSGDMKVGSLGTLDSSVAPAVDQLLSFDGSVSKWRPRTVQLSFNSGVMVASALGDGSQWVGANSNPTLSGTNIPPNSAPVVTPVYGGFIIDMSNTTLPANCVYVLDYKKNAGSFTTNAIICTSSKVVHQIIQNNTSGGAGTSSDTFSYAFKIRGSADSSYSAASGAQSFSTKTEVNAFGLIAASQIAAVNLAAVVADLGVITAGRIQNAGNTAGIRVSTGYTLPGWTNYLDLTATGANFFLKTPNFSVDGNGNVVISGTLSTQAGTSGTFAKVGGVIFTSSVGAITKNANASGNVWSTTLKANTLVSAGSSVRISMRGTMTVAAGSVSLTWTLTLKLGGTTIGTFSKSFTGSASAPFVFDAIITKSAANAQGTTSYDIGWNGTVQEIDTTITDTADQTLSCDYSFTTNAAVSSTITMKNVVAEWVQS